MPASHEHQWIKIAAVRALLHDGTTRMVHPEACQLCGARRSPDEVAVEGGELDPKRPPSGRPVVDNLHDRELFK